MTTAPPLGPGGANVVRDSKKGGGGGGKGGWGVLDAGASGKRKGGVKKQKVGGSLRP